MMDQSALLALLAPAVTAHEATSAGAEAPVEPDGGRRTAAGAARTAGLRARLVRLAQRARLVRRARLRRRRCSWRAWRAGVGSAP